MTSDAIRTSIIIYPYFITVIKILHFSAIPSLQFYLSHTVTMTRYSVQIAARILITTNLCFLCGIPQSLQAQAGRAPSLDDNRFLPSPFTFPAHHWSYNRCHTVSEADSCIEYTTIETKVQIYKTYSGHERIMLLIFVVSKHKNTSHLS